jgi:hypothetical protein
MLAAVGMSCCGDRGACSDIFRLQERRISPAFFSRAHSDEYPAAVLRSLDCPRA